ncbi:MAG: endo-1,4-beta-glucanase [Thermoproteus sp.]
MRRYLAVAAAVLIVAILLAIMASRTGGKPQEVLLVPNGTTPVSAISKSPGEMMTAYYIGNGAVMLTPYPWNMKSWSGSVEVSYNGSVVTAKVDVVYTEKYNPYAPVLGYPSLRYGCDPLFGACTQSTPPLKLPTPALNADALMTLEYRVDPGTCNITDFSYDIWLTKGSGLGPGDLELMVWLFYTTPLAQSAPSPYWSYRGSYALPVYINGSPASEHVYAYLHLDQSSWSVLILAFEKPIQGGSVAIPLGDLMKTAEAVLNGTSIDLKALRLSSIDVGLEFDGAPGARLVCSYSVYRWALEGH